MPVSAADGEVRDQAAGAAPGDQQGRLRPRHQLHAEGAGQPQGDPVWTDHPRHQPRLQVIRNTLKTTFFLLNSL